MTALVEGAMLLMVSSCRLGPEHTLETQQQIEKLTVPVVPPHLVTLLISLFTTVGVSLAGVLTSLLFRTSSPRNRARSLELLWCRKVMTLELLLFMLP